MGPSEDPRQIVLNITCPDRVGIVHAVSGFLAARQLNILESQQFGDPSSKLFFMRVQAASPEEMTPGQLRTEFSALARDLDMSWEIHDLSERPALLILVSRLGHCLNDLLYRYRIGALRANVAAVVSNHQDFETLTRSYGVEFYHLPVTPETRTTQESNLVALADELEVELVVLARYMQILSPQTVERFDGRAINIHHSFLPSFKGAQPYQQAHERGVKLIGATAHYVTTELDEGPIIEQEVARVDHSHSPEEMRSMGRDIECVALARAVRWHLEHRVMLNGERTVVFR
jgi:formyltetrahydrofolate deformylase